MGAGGGQSGDEYLLGVTFATHAAVPVFKEGSSDLTKT